MDDTPLGLPGRPGKPESGVRILPPEYRLQAMVKVPTGRTRDEMVAQAEGVIRAAAANYPKILAADLARLREMLALWTHDQRNPDHWLGIHKIAHDLKGLSGTFGFGAVCAVASSLSTLTHFLSPDSRTRPEIIPALTAHLDALTVLGAAPAATGTNILIAELESTVVRLLARHGDAEWQSRGVR